MKTSLILATLIVITLIAPLMSAELVGDTLKIYIKNIENSSEIWKFRVYFDSSEYNGNDKTFDFTLNSTKLVKGNNILTNGTKVLPDQIFNFVVSSNTTTINLDYYDLWNKTDAQWTTCKIQRGQFETSYNKCLNDISVFTGANATICKTQLETCSLNLKEKDVDLSAKDDKITSLQGDIDGKKNSNWLWLAGGVVLGVLGFMVYRGEIGRGAVKEKSRTEFNPSQQG